jgi:16S rRNA (uracil1498-N3)-methyltransferase
MRIIRVYVSEPLQAGREIDISGNAAEHVIRVLRLGVGDALTLFNDSGNEHAAAISAVRGLALRARVGSPVAVNRESALALTLVQGVSRGERMDWVIQKATELGIRRIIPVLTERSVVKLDERLAARRREHWQGIAIAACEQCGRNRLPVIEAPLKLREYLALPATQVRFQLQPGADLTLRRLPADLETAELLVGPEGGLSEEESALAARFGFASLSLGPRILRTETAAIVAIAALQAARGDLG